MDQLHEPGGALTAIWLLQRVLQCDNCCPSCRARIAMFLECDESSKLERCSHCGHPKFDGTRCPCEEHIGKPANPASEQFKSLMTGPVITESEQQGWDELAESFA